MKINIYFVSYNGMSCGPFGDAIGNFLLFDLPENLGESVQTIDVYIRFHSTAPMLPTLDSMKERFEINIKKLPMFWFRRKRKLFEVTYISKACDFETITKCLNLKNNYEIFNELCKETVAAIKLIIRRIKKDDDFDFELFNKHLNSRLNYPLSSNTALKMLIEKN